MTGSDHIRTISRIINVANILWRSVSSHLLFNVALPGCGKYYAMRYIPKPRILSTPDPPACAVDRVWLCQTIWPHPNNLSVDVPANVRAQLRLRDA